MFKCSYSYEEVMHVGGPTPFCSCGSGLMQFKRVGENARNTGKYYYKCPLNENHPGSFKWFDEAAWIEEVPMSGMSTSRTLPNSIHESTSSASTHHGVKCHTSCGIKEDMLLKPLLGVFGFVSLMLLLIGFLIAKLI